MFIEDDLSVWAGNPQATTLTYSGGKLNIFGLAGSDNAVVAYRVYGTQQDFSGYDILSVKITGSNAGGQGIISFLAPDWSNYWLWYFQHNFIDERIFNYILSKPDNINGNPSLKTVSMVQVHNIPVGVTVSVRDWYVDVFPSWANVAVAKTQRRGVSP